MTLLNGAVPRQTTESICGGRYLSGSDPEAVFASGSAATGMTIEVRWRNGSQSVISAVQANRLYEIDEPASRPTSTPAPLPGTPPPMFEDVSALLAHTHHETAFDDYERQPLLPFKLSQLGPGVAWCDLEGNGHEDLVVGAGRGGVPALFRSDGRGQFTPGASDSSLSVPDDTAGMVGWQDPSGARQMLAALTGYEVKGGHAVVAFGLAEGHLTLAGSLGREMPGGGALALGDLTGDGRLALFVAGGVVPGHYPFAAPSKIYRFEAGRWILDAKNSALLDNLGIVNGAVWSDLDGDGFPELVLACEWGPIRVFHNRAGSLVETTETLGLQRFTGWWRGVTTGDLNNNGRLDIIASNWGLNSPYRASAQQPLTFFYGDISQPGETAILETEFDGHALVPRRQFNAVVASMPFLHEQFATQKAYSEATADAVLGERRVLARRVTATTLASMAFINTGRGFDAVELPREAQLAPAFSVNVGDFDGDGNEDVFLSQNFFDLQPETTRIDAGLGLWLQGDGSGKLTPVSSQRSGVRVFGEQRGAALADYDEDGRIDLVVSQNGAPTKLYRNVGARPGLRVKLKGLPGNPAGINAVMRLQFKDHQGPAREIHGGSGYWSQDSLTQVLATPTAPESLWVRWPGGRVTTTPVPSQAKEITVDAQGKLLSTR